MNCEIFNILYLRANAEVACNCSSGEKINLGWAEAGAEWSATRLFQNPRYEHMAAAFQRGETPWGEICRHCVFLRPNEPFANEMARKRLAKVHVEPSLACALRCPGCSRIHQIKERKGPVFLPVPVYRRVLQSLAQEGYDVGLFYFCGQGEPLSHPQLEDLIAATREFFPRAQLAINTNGNYRFAKIFPRRQHPDKLIVSIDGLRQNSYEQYRINGDVAEALRFMRDAKKGPEPVPIVEWKYILFRYNDSDEELIAAQHYAESLGIDSLQFVVTHTAEKSERFPTEKIEQLPIVSPLAYPETTPHLYFKRPLAQPLSPAHSGLIAGFAGAGRVQCSVDECRYWAGRLFLRGWAMGAEGAPPRALKVKVGGQLVAAATLGLAREDVLAAYPALRNRTAGFNVVCLLPHLPDEDEVAIAFDYETAEGPIYSFSIRYDLTETGARIYNDNAHCV